MQYPTIKGIDARTSTISLILLLQPNRSLANLNKNGPLSAIGFCPPNTSFYLKL